MDVRFMLPPLVVSWMMISMQLFAAAGALMLIKFHVAALNVAVCVVPNEVKLAQALELAVPTVTERACIATLLYVVCEIRI
jgi:hypothetical protein